MKVIIDREDIINHFAAKLGVCNSEIEISFERGADLNSAKVRMALTTLWDEAHRHSTETNPIPNKITLIKAVRDICPEATLAQGKEYVESVLLGQI